MALCQKEWLEEDDRRFAPCSSSEIMARDGLVSRRSALNVTFLVFHGWLFFFRLLVLAKIDHLTTSTETKTRANPVSLQQRSSVTIWLLAKDASAENISGFL